MLKTIFGTSIDTMIQRQAERYWDDSDHTKYCVHCGEALDPRKDNYIMGDEYYCENCDYVVRNMLDNFIADLIGRHVSSETLDAIMADCEVEDL